MAIPFTTINLDKPRKLRFGLGAMVQFEQYTGKKLTEIGSDMSIETAAQMLWAMLKQDEPGITPEQVYNLVDDNADNMTDVMACITEALQAAFGQSERKNSGKPKA